MDKVYYPEYLELERKHWWFRARKAILEEQLDKLPAGMSILNIGVSAMASWKKVKK